MKKYVIYSSLAIITALSVVFMAFKPNDTASTQGEKYILIEIYEVPSYKDKGVHIHYGGTKREFIPFKEFIAENHDDNGDIILDAINKLVGEGYVIESTSGGMTGAGIITKVFMKKK